MFRLIAAVALIASALPAYASSDEAWAEFAAEVEAACLDAAQDSIDAPRIVVDPYGSENFGLALVAGKAKGADAHVTKVCVYDKQSKAVELGSELLDEEMQTLQ